MRNLAAAALCISIGISAARAAELHDSFPILWGVSESGLEFGKGTKAGTNFAVPDPTYYLKHGVQLIRLPFQIARLQPQAQGPFDPIFLGYLEKITAEDHAGGAITVLDPHGYGFMDADGKPRDILTDPVAAADYVDFMRRLAEAFGRESVAIGLMNEPHTGRDEDYAEIWNRAIAAMRQAGYNGTILVPHAHWSTAADISLQTPFAGKIVDPANNWVLELHSYLDPDSTGTYRKPVASPNIGIQRLTGAIAWSRKIGVRIFLGETGAPPDPAGNAAFDAMLDKIASAPDVFWGVAVWGAGPWWKPNYPMRLDPIDAVARPQFMALERVMAPEAIYLAKDPSAADVKVSIAIDGHEIAHAVDVTAERTMAPQGLPVRQKLMPGMHDVCVRLVGSSRGQSAYVVASTWKGLSNSTDALGIVTIQGLNFKIRVPR
ncbi:glycoside hydrolase family 5 protein [Acidisoma sp. L85]|uniref:glycoside hydrolase family 5 protein n=1 Tax=Acidisoma sp. L85 TaxID=1641850 RepID=UPI00131C6662|nr:cellulase family glycosylhydrolase [Acidisoma sp. L85]